MARRIKIKTRHVAGDSAPSAPKADRLTERLDDISRRVAAIPAPDQSGLRQEIAALRDEVKALRDEMPDPPTSWNFDVRRSNGRIVEVTAHPAGQEQPTKRGSALNLYSKGD